VGALAFLDLVQHHGAFLACVDDDLAQRLFHSAAGNGDAHVLVFVVAFEARNGGQGTHQGDTAAGHNAFLDGSTGSVQRVFDASLLLFHLDLGRSAHFDHGNTAGQLGHAFLQFLAIVVGGGFLDLGADLVDPAFDVVVVARTIDDGGVFLGDLDLLG